MPSTSARFSRGTPMIAVTSPSRTARRICDPVVLPQGLTGPQILRAGRDGEVTAIIGVPRLYGAPVAGIHALPATHRLPVVRAEGLTGPQIVVGVCDGEVTAIIGVPRLYRALVEGIHARLAKRGLLVRVLLKGLIRLSTWCRRLGLRVGKLLLRPLH